MSDGVFWPEFRAWLLEHGINVNECADIEIRWTPTSVNGLGPVHMEVTEFETNQQGRRFMRDGEVAATSRMVPMRRLPSVEVVRYRTRDSA